MWTIRKIVKKGSYLYAVVPEHPRAIKYGYVLLHRVVKENELGRLLTQNEIVHHKNENKMDNRPENLEVTTNSEHARHHAKQAESVNLVCDWCGSKFVRAARNHRMKLKLGYRKVYCTGKCFHADDTARRNAPVV